MNFSVIVLSYNRAARLRRALDPILEQTSVPRENSVVDDSPGSVMRRRRRCTGETRGRDSRQRYARGNKRNPDPPRVVRRQPVITVAGAKKRGHHVESAHVSAIDRTLIDGCSA